jgi:phosphoribosylanthranilate isomerase
LPTPLVSDGSPVAGASARPAIKFCGLTRAQDVALATTIGAAFLGGIRAGGPRHLEREAWRALLAAVPGGPQRVAVVGPLEVPALLAEAQALGADVIQWHGDPTEAQARAVVAAGLRLWPVLRVSGTRLPASAWPLAEVADTLVLDAKVTGALGGTGVTLDWQALSADVGRWREAFPTHQLVLAGGLHAGNVRQAVALLTPDVVDVSSGVELAPGIKDPERMRAFVDAVRGRR